MTQRLELPVGATHPHPPNPSEGVEAQAGVARPARAAAELQSERLSSPPARGQGWVHVNVPGICNKSKQ